jgi:protein-S-isoprenylcysteine O-methyltransferase Ste14
MPTSSTTPIETGAEANDSTTRFGGWLFRRRSWLPVPIVVALLGFRAPARPPWLFWSGLAVVVGGEMLRLWAVHHIGVISRTRSDRLGPLIASGPFAHVRNPLYLGNIALWVGFTVSAGLLWLVPVILALLSIEYHAIVRWEEGLLATRLGPAYTRYLAAVPRWWPSLHPAAHGQTTVAGHGPGYSWWDTLVSERSTLTAVVLGGLLVWWKG